jgi:endonuclease/exonuclease/phosphatase (EEP) superfamily protein YafD
VQLTPEVVDSLTLPPTGKKPIEQVVGALLYYARAVEPTLMTDISSLASQQATATEDMDAKLLHLLNYYATHPNAKLRYHASYMILNIHSDAGYLNEPEARSRAGGHFFMSSKPKKGEQQHNGPLLTLSTILRMLVTSAAEAEIDALFLNAKERINIGTPPPPV